MPVSKDERRNDSPSRVSVQAVGIGAILALVSLGLFLALGGALGLFPSGPIFDEKSLREAGAQSVVWATLSWVAATFIGAFVAALTAKATDRRDGILNGVATWAVACATSCVLSCVWVMAAISMNLATRDLAATLWSKGALAIYFVADVLAIGAALVGGVLGAQSEDRGRRYVEMKRDERVPLPS